jgi:tRNA threonylcarbamoyladenosine biosynthesis protein TsaB
VRTLALDTSTAEGSVALRRDGTLVAASSGDPSRPHGVRLPGDLLALVAAAGASLADITLLAVGLGPGAFTGLRVGLATIQGLAFASRAPAVGVSAFDALAVAASRTPGPAVTIGVWLDAARGEVFAARYRVARAEMYGVEREGEPLVASPASVIASWRGEGNALPRLWIGSGVMLYESILASAVAPDLLHVVAAPLVAPLVAELAEINARSGGAGPADELKPIYVRRPDAELARQRAAAERVSR